MGSALVAGLVLHPLAVLGVEASLPAVPARHVVNGVPNHLTPNGQTLSSAAGSHAGLGAP
jgi:hypothetical protein